MNVNTSALERYEYTAGKKRIYASSTPYDKLLKNYEDVILPDLKKTGEEYVETRNGKLDDPDNVEGRYFIAIKKALEDAKTGKNYTEAMRLVARSANLGNENRENAVYDNIPTPDEAKIIFMEMGERQFPKIKHAPIRKLENFIMSFYPKVISGSGYGNKNIGEILNSNENSKKLQELKLETEELYNASCSNILAPQSKHGDIELLYAMKLLEDKLERENIKGESTKEIDRLKGKL